MELNLKRSIYSCKSKVQGYEVSANEVFVENGKVTNITGGSIKIEESEQPTIGSYTTFGVSLRNEEYIFTLNSYPQSLDAKGIILDFITQIESNI